MSHLTPEERLDALDQTLELSRHRHLASCDACRLEVMQLRAVVEEVHAGLPRAREPEPSPLFWNDLSRRVHDRIVAESALRVERRWFDWPVLAPVAVMALLVLAVAAALPRSGSETSAPVATSAGAASRASTSAPGVSSDTRVRDTTENENRGAGLGAEDQWALLTALMADEDFTTAVDGILTSVGAADKVVAQLTEAEQQELVRLLRDEMQRVGS